MKTFILAMILHPDVQKKAHQELDTVIGSARLADYEDESSLPYIRAVYKETLRWQPLTPIAQTHAVTQDDVIDGYFIPKGTAIYGNAWYVLRILIIDYSWLIPSEDPTSR